MIGYRIVPLQIHQSCWHLKILVSLEGHLADHLEDPMVGHLVDLMADHLEDPMVGPMVGRLEDPMVGRLVDHLEDPMVGRLVGLTADHLEGPTEDRKEDRLVDQMVLLGEQGGLNRCELLARLVLELPLLLPPEVMLERPTVSG